MLTKKPLTDRLDNSLVICTTMSNMITVRIIARMLAENQPSTMELLPSKMFKYSIRAIIDRS